MDTRVTLNVNETFLEILESCFQKKAKLNLIIDENGMVRAEGFIKAINKNSSGVFIELRDRRKIDLKAIVAVNGIFRPEYGEC